MKSIFLIYFFLISCSTSDFHLKGISSKEKEIKYFGFKYYGEFELVSKEDLENVKLSLKNSYSQRNIKEPENIWEELNSISSENSEIFLFKFYPETKVFPEFLKFEFETENLKPKKIYDYLEEVQNSVSRIRYYPGSGMMNQTSPFYPVYPVYQETNTKIIFRYSYLILFPKNYSFKKFSARTKNGAVLEFKKKD